MPQPVLRKHCETLSGYRRCVGNHFPTMPPIFLTVFVLFLSISCTAQFEHRKDTNVAFREAEYRSGQPDSTTKVGMKLYPNPAKNSTQLDLVGFDIGPIRIRITSLSGRVFRNDERRVFSERETLRVDFSLPPGWYLISAIQNKKVAVKRLLVR